jgi:hypothetical protein
MPPAIIVEMENSIPMKRGVLVSFFAIYGYSIPYNAIFST